MKKIVIGAALLVAASCYFIYSIIFSEEKEVVLKTKSNAIITHAENLNYEYYEKIELKDIINIENGKLDDDSITIDTTSLGKTNYTFVYESEDKLYEGNISYVVNDTTPPLVLSSGSYTTKTGTEIDFANKILCADNHDKKPNCEVTGEHDFNKAGTYNLTLTATDTSGNETIKNFSLVVKDTITSTESTYTPSKLPIEDLIKEHKNENTQIGIDVSRWQEEIDWQKVKDAGVEFAILRIGYGYDFDHYLDTTFEYNLEEAKKVGIDVGVYYYSYAASVKEAKEQAQWIVDTLDGENLELPISFDWEEWAEFNSYNISLTDLNNMALEFINIVEEAGYEGMNYGSASYLRTMWHENEHPTWLAHYTSETSYERDYYIWQLSNTGIVDGIKGDVDLNVLYLDQTP